MPAPYVSVAEAHSAGLMPQTAAVHGRLRLTQAAALASGLTVLGVFAVFSTAMYLWSLWTTDPLKSIGGFIPVVSFALILRAWRALGWEMDGSWWGLALLAVTVALVHLRDHAILELVLTPSWSIFVPPHSFVAVAYAAGAVLLFGGTRLLRVAKLPIALMLLVNPVPHFFTLHVDLPLQHASATIARGFAHALGQPLSPDQLRLMFTPEFGMFIAPGCDGIRGALTMGLLALIAGYLYGFRPRVLASVVAAAVLLGYVFNFVRLCSLVLYYVVALHVGWLRPHAEMGDYILGALLFFLATVLLFAVIGRFSATRSLRLPVLPTAEPRDELAPRSFWPRLAASAVLVMLGSVSYARAMVNGDRTPEAAAKLTPSFPQRVGAYRLERTWNETLVTGQLIFVWAHYVPEGGGRAVEVGVSPVLGAHDTLLCHSARGEDWLWHGNLQLATANGSGTGFSGLLFNDGARQYLEASTVCSGVVCGQFASERKHFGLVYSKPDTRRLLSGSPDRPIPVLLKAETNQTAETSEQARAELTASLAQFLGGADLAQFTQAYRQ